MSGSGTLSLGPDSPLSTDTDTTLDDSDHELVFAVQRFTADPLAIGAGDWQGPSHAKQGPALASEEEEASEQQLPSKKYFVDNNNDKQVLLAMCIGLTDDAGFCDFETDPFYKNVKEAKIFQNISKLKPTSKHLKSEVCRRQKGSR